MSDEALSPSSSSTLPLIEYKQPKEKKEKTFTGGIPIEIAYQIYRVANIDAVGQRFFADFMLFLQWNDPKLIGKNPAQVVFPDAGESARAPSSAEEGHDNEQAEKVIAFHPRFFIKNASSLEELENTIRLKDPSTGRVVQHVHLRGELFQFFRLQNFPFDTQNLRIEVSSKNHAGKNEFVPHTNRKSAVSSFHTMEWNMIGHKAKYVRTDPEDTTSGNIHSECQIKLKVSRMSSFYVWNVMFFTFLLTSLSFWVQGLDTAALNDRMGICLTLILTTVAFKFAIGDSLPKISYFTILDYYLTFSSWFIFLMCLEAFIVNRIQSWKADSGYDVSTLDDYLTYGWLILWAVFNVLYVSATAFSIYRQKQEEKEGKDFIYL